MKARYVLTFPSEVVDQPVAYRLVKDYDIRINILNASISSGKGGSLLLELDAHAENIDNALVFLHECGVEYEPVWRKITFEKDRCVHCGACTAVCHSEALAINRQTFHLEFDSSKCVVCGLCTTACPFRLLKSGFDQ